MSQLWMLHQGVFEAIDLENPHPDIPRWLVEAAQDSVCVGAPKPVAASTEPGGVCARTGGANAFNTSERAQGKPEAGESAEKSAKTKEVVDNA